MKYTQKWLEDNAREFLKETFNMDLYIPLVISKQMKSTFGVFRYYPSKNQPLDIRISQNLLDNYTEEQILGTLKHECVHYALYMMGKPHRDGDFYFEEVLKIYNIPATRTKSYVGPGQAYECTECKKVIKRKRRLNHNGRGYRSGCCNAPLAYKGKTTIGAAAHSSK